MSDGVSGGFDTFGGSPFMGGDVSGGNIVERWMSGDKPGAMVTAVLIVSVMLIIVLGWSEMISSTVVFSLLVVVFVAMCGLEWYDWKRLTKLRVA